MSMPRPSDNEEEYFAKEEVRLRLGLKSTIVRSEADTARCLAVAKAVGSEDAEVGEALIGLGFTADDVGILPLVPMLEVAWADGKMGYDESSLILATARRHAMDSTTPAYAKLKALTETRPSAAFFETCERIYAELLARRHGEAVQFEKASTLDLMNRVAEASGGFFGRKTISEDEQSAISDLVARLGLTR